MRLPDFLRDTLPLSSLKIEMSSSYESLAITKLHVVTLKKTVVLITDCTHPESSL